MEGTKVTVIKAKKKQVKHELDRIKLAEKKKRRLEKALAMSAAIRSELEKKKQKKKEEQERLNEKGARISVAVALHVLLGEDLDDSCNNIINVYKDYDIIVGRGQSLIPFRDLSEYSPLGQMENYWENLNFMVSSGSYVGDFCCYQFFGDDVWGSIGNLTACAETSLKIDDDDGDYVFNHLSEQVREKGTNNCKLVVSGRVRFCSAFRFRCF